TPTRNVTGVRGGRFVAERSTLLPLTVRSSHAQPTTKPTEHCARPTSPGRLTVIWARSISLFQAWAMTFQKKTDGDAVSAPVESANVLSAPVVPESRTPSML